MNPLACKLLSLLGMVQVIKSEAAKHALLDYIEMSALMRDVGQVVLADIIADEAGVCGMAHLVQKEGHKVESLLAPNGPICQAIIDLESKTRAKQAEAPNADPFNGIRFEQAAAKG